MGTVAIIYRPPDSRKRTCGAVVAVGGLDATTNSRSQRPYPRAYPPLGLPSAPPQAVIASEARQSRRPQPTALCPRPSRPGGRSPRQRDCRVAIAPRNDSWWRCERTPPVITSAPHLSLRAKRGNLDDRNRRRSALGPPPAPAAVRPGIGIAASLSLLAMTVGGVASIFPCHCDAPGQNPAPRRAGNE